MEIKRINNSDPQIAEEIAKIHQSVLIDSFLNNFGLKFLKIIYENLLQSNDSITLVSEENGKITGFLVAVPDYSKFLKIATSKKKIRLLDTILMTLKWKPWLTYKIIFSLFKVSKENPHTELQFIAVVPEYQSQGIGTKLIDQLKKELTGLGIKKYLVGTKSSDELSNKFYQRLGFTKAYTKKYFGDELNYYLSPEIKEI